MMIVTTVPRALEGKGQKTSHCLVFNLKIMGVAAQVQEKGFLEGIWKVTPPCLIDWSAYHKDNGLDKPVDKAER